MPLGPAPITQTRTILGKYVSRVAVHDGNSSGDVEEQTEGSVFFLPRSSKSSERIGYKATEKREKGGVAERRER